MKTLIGAAIFAAALMPASPGAIGSAAAAGASAEQPLKATDISARRYHRHYYRYSYRPYYRPYYYARPYYYRPYPYYAPAPFPFGLGFGFGPWGW